MNTQDYAMQKNASKSKVVVKIMKTLSLNRAAWPNLKIRVSNAEAAQGRVDGGQDWVHGGVDGATKAIGKERLSQRRKNADRGLHANLTQDGLEGPDTGEVDDLGSLHHLPGSHIQAGHITPDIGIANNRDHPGHRGALRAGEAE